jgi:7-cyano-7-deazaguanine synthase
MTKCAVLLSGGLDSAVLLAEEAAARPVQPIYVSAGLAWEAAERAAVDAFLNALAHPGVAPLASLAVDMRDLYSATHWSITGQPPAYHTPDEDVYLPGRNIVLLSKAAILCAARGISRLAIGTLDHNPFPDATPTFREALARALSLGLAHRLEIEAPYARLSKAEVVRRGVKAGVPMALTLSCMKPIAVAGRFPRHCGVCSKCRERHDAFVEAGVDDPTDYADCQFVLA